MRKIYDINEFVPYYDMDSDYSTNAKSYYHALSKNKHFMKLFTEKIIHLYNELIDEVEEHHQLTVEKINEFQNRLDNIKQEMIEFFNQWLADGVLDEVINQDILNSKASIEQLNEHKTIVENKLSVLENYLDSEIARVEQDLNDNVDFIKQNVSLNVDMFGAIGDGINDDTIAIENAISQIDSNQILEFTSGKTYKITSSLTIEPSKIRMINGNNATILIANDNPAFVWKGKKNFLGTGPDVNTNKLKNTEMFNVIKNLQFRGDMINGKYVGTGIEIEDQHSPLITACQFFNLKNGINIKGKYVRNILISDSSFWDNSFASIKFENDSEAHQAVISNCHISYSKYSIYAGTDSHIYNLHITNCDMEAQLYQNQPFVSFIRSDGVMQELMLSNSTLQSHLIEGINPENLIFLKDAKVIMLNGNYFAHSFGDCIHFPKANKITMTNNIFENIEGNAIIINVGYEIKISDNSFYSVKGICIVSDIQFGEFSITNNIAKDVFKFSNVDVSIGILNSIVSGNIIKCHAAPTLKFKSSGSVRNVTLSDNDIYWMTEGYDHRLEYVIELQGNQMTSVIAKNNKVNTRSIDSVDGVNGMIVRGVGNNFGIIIKDNIFYQLKNTRSDIVSNPLVADSIIVENNLNVRKV